MERAHRNDLLSENVQLSNPFPLLGQGVRSVLNVCKQMLKKKAAKIFVANIVWVFLPLQCKLLQTGVCNSKNNYLYLEGGQDMQYFV